MIVGLKGKIEQLSKQAEHSLAAQDRQIADLLEDVAPGNHTLAEGRERVTELDRELAAKIEGITNMEQQSALTDKKIEVQNMTSRRRRAISKQTCRRSTRRMD